MILYFDIETIPNTELQDEFLKKYPDSDQKDMALFPEFSEIVCISCGFEVNDGIGIEFKMKSFCIGDGISEKQVIEGFFNVISNPKITMISGFNILGFDIPFVFKRALVHCIKIPSIISTFDIKNGGVKKPREIKMLDIMKVWQSTGDKKTSLDIVCKTLGIESPKQEHDGSGVADMVSKGNFTDLKRYCEGDVFACYQIYSHIESLI